MLRALILVLSVTFATVAIVPARAETPSATSRPEIERMARTLLLRETVDLLRQEGLSYASKLDQEMLRGQGGPAWQVQVGLIYDPARMVRVLTDAVSRGLTSSEIAEATAFFESAPGAHILKLEIEARALMADPDTESLAVSTFADRVGSDDPRAMAILRFIDINDLIGRNVEGALNADYQFLRGLSEGRGVRRDEDEILSDVWARAEESRQSIETWMSAYLYLAYTPLEDDELDQYLTFSETKAGQALNRALFDGFDVLYRDLSYALGRAVAQSLQTSDL